MKIYHFSDKSFDGYINSAYFGDNYYSKSSEKISTIKRSYFYTDITINKIEWRFRSSQYLYIAEISKDLLYDLDSGRLKGNEDIYYLAKKVGYKGVFRDNIVVLFDKIKILKKERR